MELMVFLSFHGLSWGFESSFLYTNSIVFSKCDHGIILPCTWYIMWHVFFLCVCLYVCAFLLVSSGCWHLETNLFFSAKLCQLKCVCYLCIKHTTTTPRQNQSSQLCSIKIKVWVCKRDDFSISLGGVTQSVCSNVNKGLYRAVSNRDFVFLKKHALLQIEYKGIYIYIYMKKK